MSCWNAPRQATGHLQEDFAHQDVPLILMANAGVVTATRDAAPDAWRRLLSYLLQSFAAEAAKPCRTQPRSRRCTGHSCRYHQSSSSVPVLADPAATECSAVR